MIWDPSFSEKLCLWATRLERLEVVPFLESTGRPGRLLLPDWCSTFQTQSTYDVPPGMLYRYVRRLYSATNRQITIVYMRLGNCDSRNLHSICFFGLSVYRTYMHFYASINFYNDNNNDRVNLRWIILSLHSCWRTSTSWRMRKQNYEPFYANKFETARPCMQRLIERLLFCVC